MLLDNQAFFKAVLLDLKILPSANNLKFLMTWSKFELRTVGIAHGFNPLNTTLNLKADPGQRAMKGSVNNGYPVKDYSTFTFGVKATAATLRLPYYKEILKTLQNNVSLNYAYQNERIRPELMKWGSHSFAVKFKAQPKTAGVSPLFLGILGITAIYLYFTFNKNYYYSNT